MSETNGLSLEAEQLTAHLMILGWWPCEWTAGWVSQHSGTSRRARRVGVRSNTQTACYRFSRVYVDLIVPGTEFKDIEWWVLTDEAIRKLAYTLDNTLMGW